MRATVHTLKAILQEETRDVRDYVDLVPAEKWRLNTAFRDHYAGRPNEFLHPAIVK